MFEYFFLIIWHVGKPKEPKKGTLKILPQNLNPPPGGPLCKFGPKLAFLVNLGQAMQAYSMPCCGSVGGCGARAVSRKTPIYFMLQYKSQDFVHTLRGVSALDSSPHILVTNGLGQSRSRRSPKPLSSSHTGTPGSWSPSQRSDQWRQVLDHLFLVHQALLIGNCPMLL